MIDFVLLRLNLWKWVSRHLPLTIVLTLDAELIADNTFRAQVNGEWLEFDYATDHDTTMGAIAAGLGAIRAVGSCTATASGGLGALLDTITMIRKPGFDLAVTAAEVIGGISQAEVSISQSQQGLVIWANQNAPAPEVDYLTLFIGPLEFIGRDYVSMPDATTELASIGGTREFTVSVQGFGGTAIQRLYEIRQGMENPEILEQIQALGLIALTSGPVTDLTQVMGSLQEPRALLEARMRIGVPYGMAATADLGIIETAEITGEVE
jgi:hypothetical protein